MKSRKPDNEKIRLEALRAYEILDTQPDNSYDNFTFLASEICGTPIALISFVDEARQWFKSRKGLDVAETDRELAFCSYNLFDEEIMTVSDASMDERFSQNALVTGSPYIRFYAGAPLVTPDGLILGSLCVIDQKPGELTPSQAKALRILSEQVMVLLETRKASKKMAEALKTMKKIKEIIPICSYCHSVQMGKEAWLDLEKYIHQHADMDLSHGICPSCFRENFPEFADKD